MIVGAYETKKLSNRKIDFALLWAHFYDLLNSVRIVVQRLKMQIWSLCEVQYKDAWEFA